MTPNYQAPLIGYSGICLALTARGSLAAARRWLAEGGYPMLQAAPLRRLGPLHESGGVTPIVEDVWADIVLDPWAPDLYRFARATRLDRWLFGPDATACRHWLKDQVVHLPTLVTHNVSEYHIWSRQGFRCLLEIHRGCLDPYHPIDSQRRVDELIEWAMNQRYGQGNRRYVNGDLWNPLLLDTAHLQRYYATGERQNLLDNSEFLHTLLEHRLLAPVVHFQCVRGTDETARCLAGERPRSVVLLLMVRNYLRDHAQDYWQSGQARPLTVVNETTPLHAGLAWAASHCPLALVSAAGAARFQELMLTQLNHHLIC